MHTKRLSLKLAGFTLVELIVALVIIGVLAGIAWISYNALNHQSRVTAAEVLAHQIDREAVAAGVADNSPITPTLVAQTLNTNLVASGGNQPAMHDPVAVGDTYTSGNYTLEVTGAGAYAITDGVVTVCYVPDAASVGQLSSSNAFFEGDCAGGQLPGGGTPLTAPGAVNTLVVTNDAGDNVDLAWSPPSTGGAPDGYTVSVARRDGSPMTETPQSTVTGVTANVSGLLANIEYEFTVTAYNSAGSSDPAQVDVQGPGVATSLGKSFIAVTPGQVTVTWAQAPRAASYTIWRFGAGPGSMAAELDPAFSAYKYEDNGGAWTQIGTVPANTTSYTDTLAGSGKYVYRIHSVNVRGEVISTERVPVTAVRSGGALTDTLGQGGSIICKNASGSGGKYLLAVSETSGLNSVINYSVASFTKPTVTGSFDPNTHPAGIILAIPGNTIQDVWLTDAATGATLAHKAPSGSFGSAAQPICP